MPVQNRECKQVTNFMPTNWRGIGAKMKKRDEYVIAWEGRKLTDKEAQILKELLEDGDASSQFATRLKLLGYSYQRELDTNTVSFDRFRQVVWFIENSPKFESPIHEFLAMDAFPEPLFRTCIKKWLLQIDNHNRDRLIIFNTAIFCFVRDFKLAHSFISELQRLEEDNRQYSFVLCTNAQRMLHKCADFARKTDFAKIVVDEGMKLEKLGFLSSEEEKLINGAISEAALCLQDLKKAVTYANKIRINKQSDHGLSDIVNNVLGLVALSNNDVIRSKRYFSRLDGFSDLRCDFATSLFQKGETQIVLHALKQHLGTVLASDEVLPVIAGLRDGLQP